MSIVTTAEKKAESEAIDTIIIVAIIAFILWFADNRIKKSTGGKIGLLGAIEIGAGGVVAYNLYKVFGSGGYAVIDSTGAAANVLTAGTVADTAGAAAATDAAGAAAATAAEEAAAEEAAAGLMIL